MSESLTKINQDILNSIQESKNRLRKLSKEMSDSQVKSYDNTQLADRIEEILKK